MKPISLKSVTQYVEENISLFHKKRIDSLDNLKLTDVLKRKNPYLFKAKNALLAQDIVQGIVDAHISSQEETIFGDWLEGLAIFINSKVYGGRKSGISGIDLEFDEGGKRYIVTIKSGPNWANSKQLKEMLTSFKTATKILRTSGSGLTVVAVNGCCYGRDNKPDKGDYFKYCGQQFWKFISGNDRLFIDIIEPLGHKAKEKNDDFIQLYAKVITKFTAAFISDFCKKDFSIDWEKLVEFNSSITAPPKKKKSRKKKASKIAKPKKKA